METMKRIKDRPTTAKAGHETSSHPLTLEDVAQLADKSDQLSCATMDHLRLFVRSDELFAPQLTVLESMARDAGLGESNDRLYAGLQCNEELDDLLESRDWQHPAEVLDPEGTLGISYRELIRIAEARARRAEESAALDEVRDKLELALAAEKAKTYCVDAFVAALLAMDSKEAERLLRRATRAYRSHQRRRQPGEAVTP